MSVRGIDQERVGAWLVENIKGAQAPFTFDLIAGGRSNLTYQVTDGRAQRYVLRRPPLGNVLATAHDMAREHRIIAAVGQTAVPVAPALGLCTDDSVNGAPFYVMGFIDGIVLDSPAAGESIPVANRTRAAHSLIDVLARLHAVDPDRIGLGDLAKREDWLGRQLRRWTTQWENSKTRELPAIDRVVAELTARKPEQLHTGIVHGDYRLGNCLVTRDTGEIAAVLDWELCTLGDLLADVGYLLVYYSDPGSTLGRANDPSGSEGFPTRAELLARYQSITGRDLGGIGYYEAFASWRLACISEGVYARYKAGVMADVVDAEGLAAMEAGTRNLVARAEACLGLV